MKENQKRCCLLGNTDTLGRLSTEEEADIKRIKVTSCSSHQSRQLRSCYRQETG